jgi:hypothetical protein
MKNANYQRFIKNSVISGGEKDNSVTRYFIWTVLLVIAGAVIGNLFN